MLWGIVKIMGRRQDKQLDLNNILLNLSKPCKDSLDDTLLKLKKIYDDDFRHYYSSLCPVIRRVCNNSPEDLECLILNLDVIIEKEQSANDKNEVFLGKIRKLYDHINLELIRFNTEKNIVGKLKQAEKTLSEAEEKLEKAKVELNDVKNKADETSKQLVTVLSIFSAIVIAFTGGVSLLSGAFDSLMHAELIEILILVFTVGGLLYNCIFLLLYYVAKVTDKNIYSYCYKKKIICSTGCEEKCSIIKRTAKKMPMLIFVNALIMFGIIICSIIYIC